MQKKRFVLLGLLITLSPYLSFSQNADLKRTNDWRFRWNIGQFANIGRYAFQFGIERDFADNKTFSAELGLSYYKGGNTLLFERYNYNGIQGLVEYRNYVRGFNNNSIRPFLALGLFARKLDFDADVLLGFNISNVRDFQNATHFEQTSARYRTFTARLHAAAGMRLPISSTMYFEATAGPAFGNYSISNDIQRQIPFVVDNFGNPFFMSSQTGSYFSPALYGSFSFGFVISKASKSD